MAVGPGVAGAATSLAQASSLVLAARGRVEPVADPGMAWTGAAASGYAGEAAEVVAAMSVLAGSLSRASGSAGSSVSLDSGGLLSSALGLAGVAALTAPLLGAVSSAGSSVGGLSGVAGDALSDAGVELGSFDGESVGSGQVNPGAAADDRLDEILDLMLDNDVLPDVAGPSGGSAPAPSPALSEAAEMLPGWEVPEESVWWGHGQPFGVAPEGIGTEIVVEEAGLGSADTASVPLVSSVGSASAESIVAEGGASTGAEIPALSGEAQAAVEAWLDGAGAAGVANTASPAALVDLQEIELLVDRGISVEEAATTVGYPGMTAADLASVNALIDASIDRADATEIESTVDAALATAHDLGLTGGYESTGIGDFTLRDLLDVEIIASRVGGSEAEILDETGLSWIPAGGLEESISAMTELIEPYAGAFQDTAMSAPESLQSVNVAVARGVPVTEALAEAGVNLEPATYVQLVRDLDTALAQISHPW